LRSTIRTSWRSPPLDRQILNSDGILHNVHTTSTANPSFNQAQPKFKKTIEVKIEKPEFPIKVQCDAHGWMHAWWVSEDHPYYAVTDAKGAFKIADVPPAITRSSSGTRPSASRRRGVREGEGGRQGQRADGEEVTRLRRRARARRRRRLSAGVAIHGSRRPSRF